LITGRPGGERAGHPAWQHRLGLGKASIRDLTPGDIVVPPGFTRTLGGDGPVFDTALDGQAATG
jgi:hypothetical protein